MRSALLVAALLWAPAASAQAADAAASREERFAALDPEAVAVPALAFTPGKEDAERYFKFFYVHKPGVDFRTAVADIRECDGYALFDTMFVPTPRFVPYGVPEGGTRADREVEPTSSYGMIGEIIGAIMMSTQLERLAATNLRSCYAFKGYKRYGLAEKLWAKLNIGDHVASVGMRARIASGPAPTAESLGQ